MSNQSITLLSVGIRAGGPLTKYRAVTAVGAHAAIDIFGVTANDAAAAGEYVLTNVTGTAPLEAGAAIPAGTKYLIADAQGRAIAGGTVAACLAKLCPGQSAAAAGDIVEALLVLTV